MIYILILLILITLFSSLIISQFKHSNVFLFFKRHNVSINQIRLLLILLFTIALVQFLPLKGELLLIAATVLIIGFLTPLKNYFAGLYLNVKKPTNELEYLGQIYTFDQLGLLRSVLNSDTKNIKIGNAQILQLAQIKSNEAGLQINEFIQVERTQIQKIKEELILSWLQEMNLNIEATKNSMQYEQNDQDHVTISYTKTYFK